jgi:hypothetical protein
MKLFTKEIEKKLQAQYPKGGDLASQEIVAKIFNPYGRGTWYLINQDPDDPDYLWVIAKITHTEVGSVSKNELEKTRVPIIGGYKEPLERDLSWESMNALEVFNRVQAGELL